MDITDAAAVHQAAQHVGSMIGDRNLVGLVNNAGIVVSGPLLYLKPNEYRRQLEVNIDLAACRHPSLRSSLSGTDQEEAGSHRPHREHQLYHCKSCYPASRCL